MSKARQLADLGNVYDDGALSNRRINHNGDMRVAQRGTASVTPTSAASLYPVDRWGAYANPSSKYSAQQQTGGPNGLDTYVRITSLGAHTSSASDFFPFFTNLEGQDVQQFQYGSSDAKDVTLSFWVRSSLTGNFSVAFRAQGATVSYVSTYTVNVANTWEYKTVTVTGNTSTSIDNDNTLGFDINFDLGHGSSNETTANTWVSGNQNRVAGTVRLVETNGATLDITGVQLEVGDTATPFEHRSYGQELALCQRYFQKYADPRLRGVGGGGSYAARMGMTLPVIMRVAPSATLTGNISVYDGTVSASLTSLLASYTLPHSVEFDGGMTATMTTGRALVAFKVSGSSQLSLDAEL